MSGMRCDALGRIRGVARLAPSGMTEESDQPVLAAQFIEPMMDRSELFTTLMLIAYSILVAISVYALVGVIFAVYFAAVGVKRIDPAAARSHWGFRVLIVPGAAAFWPMLLRRCFRATHDAADHTATKFADGGGS